MNHKQLLRFTLLVMAALAVSSFIWIEIVNAQRGGDGILGESGAAGEFGVGGAGGGGGQGGAGGGGGGGIIGPSSSGSVAAHGEYVYVLHQGRLYQYAAYDLALVKRIKVSDANSKKRKSRRAGGLGGGGGQGGEAGADGGNGGFGGGFAFMQAGQSEDVAAFGEFVYVVQGTTLHKFAADRLNSVKAVTLKFDR